MKKCKNLGLHLFIAKHKKNTGGPPLRCMYGTKNICWTILRATDIRVGRAVSKKFGNKPATREFRILEKIYEWWKFKFTSQLTSYVFEIIDWIAVTS